jgi:hypothetical protein
VGVHEEPRSIDAVAVQVLEEGCWPGTRFMRVLRNTSKLRFVVEDGTGMGSPLE